MDFAVAVNAGGARAAGRGRGRHPARRAVAAQRPRGGAPHRGAGHRCRPRRPVGDDRGAHVLRLRRRGRRQGPQPLRVPGRAGRHQRRSRSRSRRPSRSSISASCSELAPKTILVGVLDLGDPEAETAEVVAERIRAALAPRARRAAHPRARLRHEVPPAPAGGGQAARAQRGRRAGARRAVSARAGGGVAGVETFWKRFANAPMTAFWCVANRGPRTTSKQRRSTRFAVQQPEAVTQDS